MPALFSYNRLFNYIDENNITQKDLIEQANISKNTLTKLKNDESVTTEVLLKICQALQCELEQVVELKLDTSKANLPPFNLTNRRYIGSKAKLTKWIFSKIQEHTQDCQSFCDVFAGTGSVAQTALSYYKHVLVNDILFSNKIIYNAFWGTDEYSESKLHKYKIQFNNLIQQDLEDNYFSINYGDKYFGIKDARAIGQIRDQLDSDLKSHKINQREFDILLASLVYSIDCIANTVGHFEAYRKGQAKDGRLEFRLINVTELADSKVSIYQQPANDLVRQVKADIMFLDPPYNSRQYSRFYHVLENLVVWDKPELYGVALKPKESNMSDYCRAAAPQVFDDLVRNLDCKYIVVTYNNTYNSKSKSFQNKITLEEILASLNKRGQTEIFEISHSFFNTGKTEFADHKEYLFITKVKPHDDAIKKRSPFFYVGDKYKLMPQLIKLFPPKINNYYEPFVGGGSSALYVDAKTYTLNDLDPYVIALHKFLGEYAHNRQDLFELLFNLIKEYALSCSYLGITVPTELKQQYVKTYYAKYNHQSYANLKQDYNQDHDLAKLYLLLIYGFNHMIRFNNKQLFNLPVGNVDFNKNVFQALNTYCDFRADHNVNFSSVDYLEFVKAIDFKAGDFIYFDPPYLISNSNYNKDWTEKNERELYQLLDELDARGVKFGITNLTHHKNHTNQILLDWCQKYQVFEINSNYISRFDNTKKTTSREIYITNY